MNLLLAILIYAEGAGAKKSNKKYRARVSFPPYVYTVYAL